jgi:hypothetical protein
MFVLSHWTDHSLCAGIAAKNFDIPLEQRPKFAQLLTQLNERMNILDQRSPAIYQYVKNIPSLLDEWKKIVGIVRQLSFRAPPDSS